MRLFRLFEDGINASPVDIYASARSTARDLTAKTSMGAENARNEAPNLEEARWKVARARWANVDIDPGETVVSEPTPNDRPQRRPGKEIWDEQVKIFADALKDPTRTMDSILSEYFLEFEQQLLAPIIDQKRNPALALLQRENGKRSKELLQSDRFTRVGVDGRPQGLTALDPLANKLAMAYFGMPVAPLILLPALKGTESSDDESDDGGGLLMLSERPLRFLNSYNTRVYGKRATLRMCPYLTYVTGSADND